MRRSEMDAAITSFVGAYLTWMAGTVCRALRRAGRFRKYEEKIHATIGSDAEWLISYEIARYVFGAWVEGTPPEGDLRKQKKKVLHTRRILRNRLARQPGDRTLSAEYNKAGAEWLYIQTELDRYKGVRKGQDKESASVFIEKMADIYTKCTCNAAVIGYGKHGGEQGGFSDLLRETGEDALKIYGDFQKIYGKIEMTTAPAKRLSGNLPRLARALKKNRPI